MQCTLCHTPLIHRMDAVYFACHRCHALIKDLAGYPSEAEEKACYLEHNNDVHDPGYQKFTSPISDYVLYNFGPEHEGLDFGSGTGPVISKVLQDDGYHIRQYDPYFAPDTSLLEKKYDYIACCEVIEHFFYPDKEFKLLKSMLKPGGQLICMTFLYRPHIAFRNWRYRNDPTHVIIYRDESIDYITKKYGFSSHDIFKGRRIVWRN